MVRMLSGAFISSPLCGSVQHGFALKANLILMGGIKLDRSWIAHRLHRSHTTYHNPVIVNLSLCCVTHCRGDLYRFDNLSYSRSPCNWPLLLRYWFVWRDRNLRGLPIPGRLSMV